MSYLLDKKTRKQKFIKYSLIFLALLLIIVFQGSLFKVFSSAFQFVAKPILVSGNNLGSDIYDLGAYFSSKKSLQEENDILKSRIDLLEAKFIDYNILFSENLKLKDILNRVPDGRDFILAAVLADADQSLYGTLLLDVGEKEGVLEGEKVFAWGNIPIGYIKEVYPNTAKALLYSSPGETTKVMIEENSVFMKLEGRGRGNFEMTLPRDFEIEVGTEVSLPGLRSLVVAQVDTIISDPRNSFKKALLSVPINILELKFVEIEN